jgi:hypothetical protein
MTMVAPPNEAYGLVPVAAACAAPAYAPKSSKGPEKDPASGRTMKLYIAPITAAIAPAVTSTCAIDRQSRVERSARGGHHRRVITDTPPSVRAEKPRGPRGARPLRTCDLK